MRFLGNRIQYYARVTRGSIRTPEPSSLSSRRTGGRGDEETLHFRGGVSEDTQICFLSRFEDSAMRTVCVKIRLWPSAPYAQVSCGYPRSITGECGLSSCREFASKLGWTWLGGSVVQYAQEGFSGRAEQIARLLAYPNLERS